MRTPPSTIRALIGRSGWLLLSCALAAVGLWAGCTAFDDAIVRGSDASVVMNDAGTEASATSEGGCALARVPLVRPPLTAGGVDEAFVVAARDVSLGLADSGASPTFGYDLDQSCTCKPEGESCVPVGASKGAKHCDGDEGRDNSTGVLLAEVRDITGTDPASYINDGVNGGTRGILIRVEGYNGQPNDDNVAVSFYRSIGPDHDPKPPTFEPDEVWTVDQGDLLQNTTTYESLHRGSGFVNENLLVVELQSSVLPFNSDAEIRLNDVTLTARLVKVAGGWSLEDALVVGRWAVDDVLKNMLLIQDPNKATQRICDNDLIIPLVVGKACGAADLAVSPTSDRQNAPCLALSTAIGFRATPAKLGTVINPPREDACAGKPVQTCK